MITNYSNDANDDGSFALIMMKVVARWIMIKHE